MLEKLKDFLSGSPTSADDKGPSLDVAFTALLVEAARIDDQYDDSEKALIDRIIADEFDLNAGEAADLRARAEADQAQALDHYRYSSVVKQALDETQRAAFVERLWEVVLADGKRDQYEDYLIRRLIGLIHVSDQESGAARKRAEARRG
ncbi:MAG: TerB family tellurite resistance protein [Pseudomonadota bacterium]